MAKVTMSKKLYAAIKTAGIPAYRLAIEAGLTASLLSRLMHGIDPIKPGDPRIIAVGKTLSVPAGECFEEQK